MASSAASREACRDYLATLLETKLVTDLGEVEAVYNYQKGRLDGLTPVVMVVSAGSGRSRHGLGSEKFRSRFRFLIKNCVAEAETAEGWTEQDVDDMLDLLEKRVSDVVMDNRKNGSSPWANGQLYLDSEQKDGFSEIVAVSDLSGQGYQIEMIPVIAEVYDV